MKLLFLTQTYPRYPGDTAGPFIRDLARGLVRGGDEVTVLTPHAAEVAAAWDDDGVRVRSFRYAPEAWELVGYSRSLDADEAVRRGAALVAPFYLAGAWQALRRELRQVSYDLVHAHWVVPNGLAAALPGRGAVPMAVGLHGSDVFLAEKPGARLLVRAALAGTSLLTGCSPELVERVRALGGGAGGFARERSRVIPYGVDVDLFSPDRGRRGLWRERLGIAEDAPMILSVGRMATKKGYQVLLPVLPRLLARHPAAHVVLAGAGDLLEGFRRQMAAEAVGERVHFPGPVLRDTLPDLYRAADVFVLPAVHDPQGNVDGLPNVILEAMASGLPVVASAISGIPLAVEDGETGRLLPEGEPEALLESLDDLLCRREIWRALGERGRARAVGELTWDAVAGRYRDAYRGVVASA